MAADFPQQHWHQTSSVFMFMALFTIRAHLTDIERRRTRNTLCYPWSFPPIAFGCTLIASYYELGCVDSRASVLGIIVIIITYKNDPGGLWPFRNEAPPVYYWNRRKHSHCDKLVMTNNITAVWCLSPLSYPDGPLEVSVLYCPCRHHCENWYRRVQRNSLCLVKPPDADIREWKKKTRFALNNSYIHL